MAIGFTWILFILTAVVIVIAGYRMTVYGDIIGGRSSLGYTWVGTILLASVTSLPELVTAFTVSTLGKADIVIGNIFGSNNFNMLIVFIIDLMIIIPVLRKVQKTHIASGIIAILLSIIAILSMGLQFIIGRDNLGFYSTLPIGLDSLLIITGYICGMIYIFKDASASASAPVSPNEKYKEISTRMAYIRYSLYALVIVSSGIFMGILGAKLADAPINIFGISLTLGGTLMGTIFFAITTSLPELVVTMSSIKLKSYDMALGNVLGSNLFNLAIIGMADIFFIRGPILVHADYNQLITIILSVLMIGLVILGINNGSKKVIFRKLSFETLFLPILYLVGFIILWKLNMMVN
jgi:cation:H+ antiporter